LASRAAAQAPRPRLVRLQAPRLPLERRAQVRRLPLARGWAQAPRFPLARHQAQAWRLALHWAPALRQADQPVAALQRQVRMHR
jgi:hypothetical protein